MLLTVNLLVNGHRLLVRPDRRLKLARVVQQYREVIETLRDRRMVLAVQRSIGCERSPIEPLCFGVIPLVVEQDAKIVKRTRGVRMSLAVQLELDRERTSVQPLRFFRLVQFENAVR